MLRLTAASRVINFYYFLKKEVMKSGDSIGRGEREEAL